MNMSRKSTRWCLKIEKLTRSVSFRKQASQRILFIPSYVNICLCPRCVLNGYWRQKWRIPEPQRISPCWPGITQIQNSYIHVWLWAMRRGFITKTQNRSLNSWKGKKLILLEEACSKSHTPPRILWQLYCKTVCWWMSTTCMRVRQWVGNAMLICFWRCRNPSKMSARANFGVEFWNKVTPLYTSTKLPCMLCAIMGGNGYYTHIFSGPTQRKLIHKSTFTDLPS